jgi:hypothetical protein
MTADFCLSDHMIIDWHDFDLDSVDESRPGYRSSIKSLEVDGYLTYFDEKEGRPQAIMEDDDSLVLLSPHLHADQLDSDNVPFHSRSKRVTSNIVNLGTSDTLIQNMRELEHTFIRDKKTTNSNRRQRKTKSNKPKTMPAKSTIESERILSPPRKHDLLIRNLESWERRLSKENTSFSHPRIRRSANKLSQMCTSQGGPYLPQKARTIPRKKASENSKKKNWIHEEIICIPSTEELPPSSLKDSDQCYRNLLEKNKRNQTLTPWSKMSKDCRRKDLRTPNHSYTRQTTKRESLESIQQSSIRHDSSIPMSIRVDARDDDHQDVFECLKRARMIREKIRLASMTRRMLDEPSNTIRIDREQQQNSSRTFSRNTTTQQYVHDSYSAKHHPHFISHQRRRDVVYDTSPEIEKRKPIHMMLPMERRNILPRKVIALRSPRISGWRKFGIE